MGQSNFDWPVAFSTRHVPASLLLYLVIYGWNNVMKFRVRPY